MLPHEMNGGLALGVDYGAADVAMEQRLGVLLRVLASGLAVHGRSSSTDPIVEPLVQRGLLGPFPVGAISSIPRDSKTP